MSKREWKPGDVAMISRGDRGPVIGFRDCDMGTPGWALGKHLGGSVWVAEGDVTDARPLVVIDPEDREQVERLLTAILHHQPKELVGGDRNVWDAQFCDALTAALREFANPTPPKPDEPTGLGAVVEDVDGKRWVRTDGTGPAWSMWENAIGRWSWSRIDAVRVLSEGVADV